MSTLIAVVVLIASVIAIFTIPHHAVKDGFKSGVLITMLKMMISVLAMLSSGLYLVL